ncbi:MAG: symmetrical bis(5'-nucleosyl)-tetraphosphatase [Rickettsiales bacterium]|nr:symmetrical bis(5'-nucleosyl)-tetraphosphatase [Rickettsiales bacterium]
MSSWAIGDVQGCFAELQDLLTAIAFVPGRDRLFLLGDLVNRGPNSLDVLRWAFTTPGVEAVLGNHDLWLLALHQGLAEQRKGDSLKQVLAACDCDQLLRWLRGRPILMEAQGYVMVHAALHPQWTWHQARSRARRIEACLRADRSEMLLRCYLKGSSDTGELNSAVSELAQDLGFFTRLRCLDADGRARRDVVGPLAELPEGCLPWWRWPGASRAEMKLLFGHWSAIGVHREEGICALDSGCVWGRQLSAFCLDDERLVQVEARSS